MHICICVYVYTVCILFTKSTMVYVRDLNSVSYSAFCVYLGMHGLHVFQITFSVMIISPCFQLG